MNLPVVLRCGIGEHRNSEAVDDIEQETETETFPSATEAKDRDTGIEDHAVAEHPSKLPRSQQNKLW